jgi:hypothetical protein
MGGEGKEGRRTYFLIAEIGRDLDELGVVE